MDTPLIVQCPGCGAQLRIKNASAVGKQAPCPKCRTVFVVEAPPEDEIAFGGHDDFGDDEFSDGEDVDSSTSSPANSPRRANSRNSRGSRKKKAAATDWRGRAQLIGALALGLLVIAGIGFGLRGLINGRGLGGGSAPETAWLPADMDLLIQVRVADAIKSPVFQKIIQDPAIAAGIASTAEETGLGLADIERATIAISSGGADVSRFNPGENFCVVMVTSKPISLEKWMAAIQKNSGVELETQDYAGKQLHVGRSGGQAVAMVLVDEVTALFGSDRLVKQSLDSGGVCAAAPRFNWANGDAHVLVVYAPADPTQFDNSGMTLQSNGPFGGAHQKVSDELQGLFGTIQFASGITANYGMKSRTSAVAQGSATNLESEVRGYAAAVAQQRQQLNAGFNPIKILLGDTADRLLGHIETALREAKAASRGQITQVTLSLPGEFIDDAKPLLTLAGAGGLDGFGGPAFNPMTAPPGPSFSPGGPPGFSPPPFPQHGPGFRPEFARPPGSIVPPGTSPDESAPGSLPTDTKT